jgi:hypothetical protein
VPLSFFPGLFILTGEWVDIKNLADKSRYIPKSKEKTFRKRIEPPNRS